MTGRGVVAWFTGLPGSGKTTLANHVRDRLALRASCVMLDSDELRDVLGQHAYTADSRDAFYRTLGKLATLVARQGHVVLVAATAPRRAHRDQTRAEAPSFVEVYVRATVDECEARDVKGLYARARSHELTSLPGIGAPYEPPLAPDVIAEGGFDTEAATVIDRLVTHQVLAPIHANQQPEIR